MKKLYEDTPTPAEVLKMERARAKRESLEAAMLQQLRALGLTQTGDFARELQFNPVRKWRLDFAWSRSKVALEVDGGTRTGGRHVRGEGFERDCAKHASAMLMGYRVFRATDRQVKDGTAAFWIEQALGKRVDPNVIPGGPYAVNLGTGEVRKATPAEEAEYRGSTRVVKARDE